MREPFADGEKSGVGREFGLIPEEDLPEILPKLVLDSPVSTWIADAGGTLLFQNDACRRLFGIERDEEVVGKYNIFKDEVLAAGGFMPQIRKVFEEGGATELILEYDLAEVRYLGITRSLPRVLRGFLFGIKDGSGRVKYVIVQHEDYTERWVAQRSLENSEARYRQLVEDISDWVWEVDSEIRYTYSSPVVERILGYKVEDVVGKSALDFIIPEDRPQAQEEFGKAVAGGKEVLRFMTRSRRKDGTLCYLEASAEPIRDETGVLTGFRGIDRDITERIRSEEALRRSAENLRALFHYMPAATFSYDREGKIIQVNSAFERLYGYSNEQVAGKRIIDTISDPELKEITDEIVKRVFSGEILENLEWEDRRADGSTIYVITSTTPVYDASGDVTMGFSLNVDITERKLAEQRRRELEERSRDFYRRTILAATDGKLVILDRDDMEKMLTSPIASWETTETEDLSGIRHTIADIARKEGMLESRIDDFVLLLGEAATNAYKHAGGGTISLYRRDGSLMFSVSDKGPGIDTLILPEATLKKGYSTAGSLGMGYKTIICVADEVYLCTGPAGTTVAVQMRLKPEEEKIDIELLPDTW